MIKSYLQKKSQSFSSERVLPKEDQIENEVEVEDEKMLDEEKSINARDSSQHSFRYIFQYFLFFCFIMFQAFTQEAA